MKRVRPGFLLTFTVLMLMLAGGVGYVVSSLLGSDIRSEQIAAARERTQLLAQSAFAPALRRKLHGRTAGQLEHFDQAALAASRTGDIQSLAVWDAKGRIVYATDHRQIDKIYRVPDAVAEALQGKTVSVTMHQPTSPIDQSKGEQIQVAVPLYGSDKKPQAAFEIHVPYAPIAAEISRRTRRINFVLLGAMLLFMAALWPRLLAASRALKATSDPKKRLLLAELRKAIDEEQVVLHYQPKVDLRTGAVPSVEALIRWNHPKHGRMSPGDFLPVASGSDLMGPLTVHLIELALRDCAAWRANGVTAGVDVNLSEANVLDPQLPAEVERLLAKWDLPSKAIGFELTEHAIQSDPEKAAVVLRDLSDRGVRLALDDFGTGYSSLAVLRDLPIREIKIDRAFINGLTSSPADETIVRSTIGLAHDLELSVTAEGVEDEDTLRHLAELGCDEAQGYFFSRPLELPALLGWFAQPVIDAEVPAADAEPADAEAVPACCAACSSASAACSSRPPSRRAAARTTSRAPRTPATSSRPAWSR
jgi:EAL domain-containing protein (putative c-di-GMP-specific phosphodiesterase class I)